MGQEEMICSFSIAYIYVPQEADTRMELEMQDFGVCVCVGGGGGGGMLVKEKGEREQEAMGRASGHVASLMSMKGEQEGRIR